MDSTCSCGRTFTQEQSSGDTCFPCKLGGVAFNWVGGGGYGRKQFHATTNAEVIRETERNAARAGVKMTRQPVRAELV